MKKSKKFIVALMALLFTFVLVACSNSGSDSAKSGSGSESASEENYVPDKLTIQFIPSTQADTLEAKAKPLEKMLSDKLGIPVEVSVSTDYNSLVEGMDSKKIDVGFLAPDGYVTAHDRGAADILLMSERYAITQPGGKEDKSKKTSTYRSMIITKKGSDIKDIKDLKGKKIAVQDISSTSGYIFPVAELKTKGIDVVKDSDLVTVKGHDQGVLSVLNGDTDAAFVFEDARNIVKDDEPDIMDEVQPIYFTKPIPNDTISVRSDMDPKFRDKLAQAFIDLTDDKEAAKILEEIYSHVGYVRAKDSDFDVVREYSKSVSED